MAPQRPFPNAPLPVGEHPHASDYAQQLLGACGLNDLPVDPRPEPTPAVEWARSGAMALTGKPDDAPRFANGPVATAARGAGLALAALAPHSPLTTLDAPALFGERGAIAGLARAGRISAGGSARLLETATDTIVVNLPRPEDWSLVPAWLESEDVPSPPAGWLAISEIVANKDGRALTQRGRLIGLAAASLASRIEGHCPPFRIESSTEVAPIALTRPYRLLDLSSLWAGPLATSMLAMSGVEVLKIESPSRPDGARNGPREFFDLMNGNKQGCALDLTSSRDRSVFDRLLDSTDIVFESARPRALEQMGYDAAGWTLERPGRLWVSITGYGRGEPERNWIAFGDDAAISAGLIGSPDTFDALAPRGLPSFCGDAIADPLTGLHAAVATLGHLRAGRGGVISISLRDVCSHAGGISAGPLSSPIRCGPDGKHELIEGHRVPIAEPRARDAIGAAPPLTSASEALLSRWTRDC